MLLRLQTYLYDENQVKYYIQKLLETKIKPRKIFPCNEYHFQNKVIVLIHQCIHSSSIPGPLTASRIWWDLARGGPR